MLSSPSMGQLLKNAAFNLDSEKKAELEKTHESPVRAVQHSLVSAVNSVFLSNTKTEKLDSPVTFAFSHSVSPWVGRGDQPHCSPHSQSHGGPSAAFIPHLHPFCFFLKRSSETLRLLWSLPGTLFPHITQFLMCFQSLFKCHFLFKAFHDLIYNDNL